VSLTKAYRTLAKSNGDYAKLRERHGKLDFEPKTMRSPFESLVRAIAHQQLHGKAAEAILGRLINKFSPSDFPTPAQLIALEIDEFRLCGFSQAKAKSIKDIAEKTVQGIVPTCEEIALLEDEAIIERLTQIRGVGRWTVEMLLIFQLGRMDVWPVDDFGIQTGYRILKRKKERPPKKHLHAYGEKWKPYRTAAALYLWREANLARELQLAKTKAAKLKKRLK
jgi:DNA-3-methyladenine glycosylase II